MNYPYGKAETDYLCQCDPKLAQLIARYGHIERQLHDDIFTAIVNSIVSQQISGKAAQTVWNRLVEAVGTVTPQSIDSLGQEALAALGMSGRKAGYIHAAAQAVLTGALDLQALTTLPDEQIIKALCALPGIGQWTAEMLLIFSLRRPDVLSFGDFAIRKGLCLLYGHETLTKTEFARYQQRFSPYGTVASFYLWAYANEQP